MAPLQIVFLIIALATVISAVMVVTTRRIMHAALWLIMALLGVAGLFATLNRERSVVMDGIERFSQRRAQIADRIKTEARQMRELQDMPNRDESKVDELTHRIDWDTRVFEDQRKTIGYVCEVPTIIERRLGALARAIQQSIE